jgi:hypothetical protein
MSNLRLSVRRDPLGRVTIDVPAPQCSLSTVEPIGAHLTVQLTDERAKQLCASLTAVLNEGSEEDR